MPGNAISTVTPSPAPGLQQIIAATQPAILRPLLFRTTPSHLFRQVLLHHATQHLHFSNAVNLALSAAENATLYSDNCSDDEHLNVYSSISGSCNAVITVIVTDVCGNSNSVFYNTRIDNVAPVPPAAPAAESYTCLEDVPAPGTLTATDNCSGLITVTGVDTPNGGSGCINDPLIITRTWTFTDLCDHSSSVSQTITVIDNVAPSFTRPVDTEIFTSADCSFDASPAITGDVTDETDNCSACIECYIYG